MRLTPQDHLGIRAHLRLLHPISVPKKISLGLLSWGPLPKVGRARVQLALSRTYGADLPPSVDNRAFDFR